MVDEELIDGPDLPAVPDGGEAVADAHDDDAVVALPDRDLDAVEQEIRIADIFELENIRPELTDIPELAESIRVRGLLHPVCVRPAPEDASHGHKYELIVGYRRRAACELLGRETIKARVYGADEADVLADMLTENLMRKQLSPVAEARAMKRMMQTFGWTQGQVAAHLGVDRTQVTKRIGMLEKLAAPVLGLIEEGKLTASHGEVIARLETPEAQEQLADLAVRTEAPVSKLNSYASKIKDEQEQIDAVVEAGEQVLDQDLPLDVLPYEAAVALPALRVRDDLSAGQLGRANLYILLRAGNDTEMLEHLEERVGVPLEGLWDWVAELDEDQVAEMAETMVRRWLGAAHRLPTLPASLRAQLGSGETTIGPPAPDLPEGADDFDDEDDFGFDDPAFNDDDGLDDDF